MQVVTLYKNMKKIEYDKFKLMASLHGVTLNDSPQSGNSKFTKDPEVPLFGNPDDYANLSEEQKNSLTEKMMNKHKFWSSNALG